MPRLNVKIAQRFITTPIYVELGPTGPQGDQGIQGIQGIQGDQGIQGVNASEVFLIHQAVDTVNQQVLYHSLRRESQ
jgi:hypothetical protein